MRNYYWLYTKTQLAIGLLKDVLTLLNFRGQSMENKSLFKFNTRIQPLYYQSVLGKLFLYVMTMHQLMVNSAWKICTKGPYTVCISQEARTCTHGITWCVLKPISYCVTRLNDAFPISQKLNKCPETAGRLAWPLPQC